MEISIIQALLVFVVAFIMGIDQFSFLESLYQPIVTCPIIGAILGNFELGVVVGGAYQLVQIGSMPIGGAQPPNAIIGGIMATVFAVSLGMEATADGVGAALGLAVPFAVFGQYVVTLTFTIFSGMMHKADQYAEEANVKGIRNINFLEMAVLGVLFGVISVDVYKRQALPMCRGRQAFCWTQTEQRRLLSIILKMNGITRREAWSFRQPSTSPGAARRS